MPTNTLTDARCKGAKPAEKPYKLFDGGGLHLYVSATGSRTWRLAYRVAGKPQTMSLGPYPEVSLSEARAKRRYIEREGVGPEGEQGQAYGPHTDDADMDAFERRARDDRHQFRFIVSPADNGM